MAPVVHGLEKQFDGQVDFLYLNIADARNDSLKKAFGFRATPQFFFVSPGGVVRDSIYGVVPEDSLRAVIRRLLLETPPRLQPARRGER